ncbi:hypothetical protein Patl1_18728 [Pistacia atlantica]|uniref:Uncharacterized protein n=1 Tax=Pistacia atlantica TaxID=434234 RepID=A0ACC1BXC5_9ROSI|nr:hypothetical protein Patl1_18728 [Pistacia atlantica]
MLMVTVNMSDSSSESEDEDNGPSKEECIAKFKEMLKERRWLHSQNGRRNCKDSI